MVQRFPRSPSKEGCTGYSRPKYYTYEFVAQRKRGKMAPGRCPIARAELHSRAVARRYHVGAANVAAPQLPRLLPPAAALSSILLPRTRCRSIVVISRCISQGLAPLQHLSHCLSTPRGRARSVPSPPIPGPSSVAELCISGWVRCCAVLACVAVLAPRSSLPTKLPRLAESRDATHPLAK